MASRTPAPRIVCLILTVGLGLLSGCALHDTEAAATVNAGLRGKVYGGQQPVVGATIQLYKVGTSADFSASTPMLTQTVKTGPDGGFVLDTLYNCNGATLVYLTATGGNPGAALDNPNIGAMVALGPCANLGSGTFITVNEITTVAATSALEPWMSSLTAIGSGSSDATALANAFTLASEYVNPATGQTPGTGVPSGYTAPVQLINTLGDILAYCLNSSGGGASGDGTNCGNLFALAKNGTAAPTDTATAALNIARNPTANLTTLFNLASPSGPFQTELTAAPASWQLTLQPSSTAITRTFIVEPDAGFSQIYALVNGAKHTIDMTMYELVDTTFSGDLVAACNRGVKVRVILDQNNEKSSNTAAYNQINAVANCAAVYANPQFQVTHQKSFIVDGATVAIMSLNLTSRYYSTTRDYALVENDPVDIAAIQTTFNTDYGSTTDLSYQPPTGNDLIWSPTTATTALLGIINNAKSTLLVENEEMSATNIVTALENACKRGVVVHIAMTDTGSYHANYTALEAAGCGVHTYADNSTTLYIHAKALLADYGLSTANAYMGSINFSTASMTENRELGLYITDTGIQTTIYNTINSDYAGAPAY